VERKAPTFQSKARGLQVFLCCKSSSSLSHHPYISFSGIPGISEVATDYQTLFAQLLLPCGKSKMMGLGHTADQEAYE